MTRLHDEAKTPPGVIDRNIARRALCRRSANASATAYACAHAAAHAYAYADAFAAATVHRIKKGGFWPPFVF
jgi:hypothetical protein